MNIFEKNKIFAFVNIFVYSIKLNPIFKSIHRFNTKYKKNDVNKKHLQNIRLIYIYIIR